jgi:hypothetical protein
MLVNQAHICCTGVPSGIEAKILKVSVEKKEKRTACTYDRFLESDYIHIKIKNYKYI